MRILYVVKTLSLTNGVSSYLMNYYRELIKQKNIICDFLIISDKGSPYYDEIIKNNGNIYILPSIKNPFNCIKFLNKLFKNNKYDILHSNVINSGALISFIAKKHKVPVRILHSHTTSNGDTALKIIRNYPFQVFCMLNSNVYFACSKLAGESIFKGKKFDIIPNAIDLPKFEFSNQKREEIRKGNDISEDTIIVGVVGRITLQKNPYFIMKIASCLKKENIKFILWWFGTGDMSEEIFKEADKLNLSSNIKFWGAVNDVYKYYSAMDCLILPSLYEGLPVVGIEAQAAGLQCFFSDRITKEARLNQYTEFLSIDDEYIWVKKIKNCLLNSRKEICDSTNLSNYSINNLGIALYEKYLYYLKEKV